MNPFHQSNPIHRHILAERLSVHVPFQLSVLLHLSFLSSVFVNRLNRNFYHDEILRPDPRSCSICTSTHRCESDESSSSARGRPARTPALALQECCGQPPETMPSEFGSGELRGHIFLHLVPRAGQDHNRVMLPDDVRKCGAVRPVGRYGHQMYAGRPT